MSKKFFRIFTIADFKEEENWLREQSKAGLRLENVSTLGNYTFEETKPEDVIYRLDYENAQNTKKYTEAGWEHVLEQNGCSYFRKAAAERNFGNSEENMKQLNGKHARMDVLFSMLTGIVSQK